MAGARRTQWWERMEERLKHVFGPAQVDDPGQPRPRATDRLGGAGAAYEVRRDSSDTTYVVARPRD